MIVLQLRIAARTSGRASLGLLPHVEGPTAALDRVGSFFDCAEVKAFPLLWLELNVPSHTFCCPTPSTLCYVSVSSYTFDPSLRVRVPLRLGPADRARPPLRTPLSLGGLPVRDVVLRHRPIAPDLPVDPPHRPIASHPFPPASGLQDLSVRHRSATSPLSLDPVLTGVEPAPGEQGID